MATPIEYTHRLLNKDYLIWNGDQQEQPEPAQPEPEQPDKDAASDELDAIVNEPPKDKEKTAEPEKKDEEKATKPKFDEPKGNALKWTKEHLDPRLSGEWGFGYYIDGGEAIYIDNDKVNYIYPEMWGTIHKHDKWLGVGLELGKAEGRTPISLYSSDKWALKATPDFNINFNKYYPTDQSSHELSTNISAKIYFDIRDSRIRPGMAIGGGLIWSDLEWPSLAVPSGLGMDYFGSVFAEIRAAESVSIEPSLKGSGNHFNYYEGNFGNNVWTRGYRLTPGIGISFESENDYAPQTVRLDYRYTLGDQQSPVISPENGDTITVNSSDTAWYPLSGHELRFKAQWGEELWQLGMEIICFEEDLENFNPISSLNGTISANTPIGEFSISGGKKEGISPYYLMNNNWYVSAQYMTKPLLKSVFKITTPVDLRVGIRGTGAEYTDKVEDQRYRVSSGTLKLESLF